MLEVALNLQIKPIFDGKTWRVENDYVAATQLKTSSDVMEVIAHIKEKAASAKNARDRGLFAAEVMIRRPQSRLALLEQYAKGGLISPEKAWKIARDTWLSVDEVYPSIELWESFFTQFFSDSSAFMTSHELAHLDKLPNEIKIYRGYDRAHRRTGLSWTMSKLIASQYASRFKSTIIAQGVVNKSEVVGYLSMRGHHEIVLKSRGSVSNQRAVGAVKGDEAMRWVYLNAKNGGFL